ncbi:uncharacterized protein [Lepisosteus oculatus]|uniref:uncharacterized protein isoform X2 n=1 Tax=Lepisosteus oculatus TaxID=7918 RepID=UPI0037100B76
MGKNIVLLLLLLSVPQWPAQAPASTPVLVTSSPADVISSTADVISTTSDDISSPVDVSSTPVFLKALYVLQLQFIIQLNFTADLADHNTSGFKALDSNITSEINKVFRSRFSNSFNRSEVKQFSPSSGYISAQLDLVFENRDSVTIEDTLCTLRTVASVPSLLRFKVDPLSIQKSTIAPTAPAPTTTSVSMTTAAAPPSPPALPSMKLKVGLNVNMKARQPGGCQNATLSGTEETEKAYRTKFGFVFGFDMQIGFRQGSLFTDTEMMFNASSVGPDTCELTKDPHSSNMSASVEVHHLQFHLLHNISADLANLSSPESRALSSTIVVEVDKVFSSRFSGSFNHSEVMQFGSSPVSRYIRVQLDLMFRNGSGVTVAEAVCTLSTAASVLSWPFSVDPPSVQPYEADFPSPTLGVLETTVASVTDHITSKMTGVTSITDHMTSITDRVPSATDHVTSVPDHITSTMSGVTSMTADPSQVTLQLQFSLMQKYTPDLNNPSSAAFSALAHTIISEVGVVLSSQYSGSFLRSEVKRFSSGSVIVDLDLGFDGRSFVPNVGAVISTLQTAQANNSFTFPLIPGSIQLLGQLITTQAPNTPVDVTTGLANVTSTPSSVTSTPANITSTPANITTGLANVTFMTANITSTPASVTSTPANITTGLANITSTPANITTGLANITSKPANITTGMANVTTGLANITSTPASVTSTPANITTGLSNITTGLANITSTPASVTSTPANITTGLANITSTPASVTSTPANITTGLTNVTTGLANITSTPASVTSTPANITTGLSNITTGLANITSTPASVTSTPANITTGLANITSTPASVTSTPANITTGLTNVTTGLANITSTPASVTSTPANITTGLSNISATPGSVIPTPSSITSTPVNITIGLVNVTSTPANITTGLANITSTSANITTGMANITSTPANVMSKPANITTGLSNVTTGLANITSTPASVTSTPANITTGLSNVTTGLANITSTPASVTSTPANITTGLANITSTPANIITGLANITSTPASVTSKPANITTGLTNVTTGLANITSTPASVTSKPANITTGLSNISTTPGSVIPTPSSITTTPVNITIGLVNVTSTHASVTSTPDSVTSRAANVTSETRFTTTTAQSTTVTAPAAQSVISLIFSLNLAFIPQLHNSSSKEFHDLAKKVTTQCDGVYRRKFGLSFLQTLLIAFSNGSVVTETALQFSTAAMPSSADIINTLKEATNTSLFNLPVIDGSIRVVSSITTARPSGTTKSAAEGTRPFTAAGVTLAATLLALPHFWH